MKHPKYIFITMGGESTFSVDNEPTDIDKQSVVQGDLQIIRISDLHELDHSLQWTPIETGKLITDKHGNYHWIEQ